jgi:hypothetical protein
MYWWSTLTRKMKVKGFFTGRNFDGMAHPFWTFKKGTQYDYSEARPVHRLAPIKEEGHPIFYDSEWEGVKFLGTWWSIQFHTKWFEIRYHYRSWTKDIFYIARI